MTASDWFDSEGFEQQRGLSGVTWGRPVRTHDETESTNDLGLAAVTGDARTGIVWIARQQTRGRGRRGSTWVAEPGEALLMSTLLRWPAPIQTATGLGLAAGLAVLGACQMRVPTELRLKWPNDVLADGAKLAGILVESRPDGKGGVGIVLGVGINVRARAFDPVAGRATSLALLGADEPSLGLESLLVDVLLGLESLVPRVLSGKLHEISADVRAVDALLGRQVQILEAGGDFHVPGSSDSLAGVARGISDAGELEVETSLGLCRVASGHVVLLP